jgi:hypothetical protein
MMESAAFPGMRIGPLGGAGEVSSAVGTLGLSGGARPVTKRFAPTPCFLGFGRRLLFVGTRGIDPQQRSRFLSKKVLFRVVRSPLVHPLDRQQALPLIQSYPHATVGHREHQTLARDAPLRHLPVPDYLLFVLRLFLLSAGCVSNIR